VYYAGLVILAVTLTATAALRRSSAGRASIAVRDNEAAAAAFGLTPASVKLRLLAVSGAAAGMAGVLWALSWASVNTTQFAPGVSLAALAVPVFGGLGSLAGAVIGSVAVFLPTFLLAPHFGAIFGQFGRNQGFQLALSGVGMIAFIMGQPFGIAGAVQNVWERWLVRLARSREERHPQEESLPLVVSGVALSFGGVKALYEVSLAVGPGEIVGLIGGNGAGKTTLMNVVSGVLRPERGSVRIRGEEVIDLAPEFRSALGLGRSFQDARLFPGLTVVETVELAMASGRRSGVLASMVSAPWVRTAERDDRAAALEVLERLGLTAWAGAHTAELSTGTRRICDLAAQVAMGPKVLLLDEPTAGVAQREAEAFAPLLRRIRDELDCSILVIEHDMPLLMGLCDRVYAMEAGAMIAEGTPEEVRNDPRVIASYLGSDEIAMARSGSRPTSGKVPRSRRTLSAAKADQ
jgi:ABC-type branched-subunit amino acid transport system ATPase component